MNKIVLNIGLLIFFLSIIFFSQRGLAVEDIIMRALIIFVVSTILMSILVIIFIRSINKTAIAKEKNLTENISREV